ncbi:uncharacterized protein [Periplaneta americana]|uniref:uncharacterized protein isoform X2 n=1 Tax=Periplaneta americana TaxID=6978 RepID=UPI0037E942A8
MMLHDKWPILTMLATAYLSGASASEEASTELPHVNPLQTFGVGLKDMVLRTFSLCGSELLGLRRDASEGSQVRKTLCTYLLKPHTETGRGHYGAPAYNTSGFDPLTLLAGLAFLAFLLQTLHALLYRQTTSVNSVGLSRKMPETPADLEHSVKTAFDKYEMLNSEGRMIDNTPWQWPSLPAAMRNLVSSYWGLRDHVPCYNDPLCSSMYNEQRHKS